MGDFYFHENFRKHNRIHEKFDGSFFCDRCKRDFIEILEHTCIKDCKSALHQQTNSTKVWKSAWANSVWRK